MLIFLSIAIGSFIIIAGSFIFGHDHDTDHAEAGHAGEGHDLSHDMEPTISFFSVKVLGVVGNQLDRSEYGVQNNRGCKGSGDRYLQTSLLPRRRYRRGAEDDRSGAFCGD